MRVVDSSTMSAILGLNFMGASKYPRAIVLIGASVMPNVMSVSITREDNSIAQGCSITLSNINPSDPIDNGYYNSQRDDTTNGKPSNSYNGLIKPGASISVLGGYGANVVSIFTGVIDTVKIKVMDGSIEIFCRDVGYRLVDNTIFSENSNQTEQYQYITYPIEAGIFTTGYNLGSGDTNPYLYDIFIDVCMRAGFNSLYIGYDNFTTRLNDLQGDYFTELSGTWDSIVLKIADILQANVYCDEDGNIFLKERTGKDYLAVAEDITLTGTTWSPLANKYCIKDSINLNDPFYDSTDYDFDYATNSIRRSVGTTIPTGTTLSIDYSYVDWVFKVGEGLYDLVQWVSHDNEYGSIQVTNSELELASYLEIHLADSSVLSHNKLLTIDMPELITQGQLDAYATAYSLMLRRNYFNIDAEVVTLPHLQVGDLVHFLVYGTATGIYEIKGFNIDYDASTGFSMSLNTIFFNTSGVYYE